jgi:hypothetical protein
MDGIVNFFKLLGSKLAIAGVCVTAAVFHFNPRVLEIPPLPSDWKWVPVAMMILTGFFCAWWIAVAIYTVSKRAWRLFHRIVTAPRPSKLNDYEKKLLVYIAHDSILGASADRAIFPDRVALEVAALDLHKKRLLVTLPSGEWTLTGIGVRFLLRHRDQLRHS